jgi:Protein of unknown function (DUF1236)
MQSRDAVLGSSGRREETESRTASAMERLPSLEVFATAASSGEENDMRKLLLLSAAAALISTGALAQSTVTTTTGTGHTAAVQIEPEYRTKIRSYVTEHKIRPVETREKIVVGSPVPSGVELEAVPAEWGPSLTKYRYVYSGERVMLVDPATRTVVQEVE